MMATNLVSRRGRPTASIDRIRRAFDDRVLALPPNEANTVAIASAGGSILVGKDELRDRARKLRTRTGLNLLPTIARLDSDDLII
jgi:spermidine synthase